MRSKICNCVATMRISKQLLTAAICLAALIPVNGAQARVSSSTDYRNIAPPDWKLLPAGSGRGRRFVSPSGDAWLWLYSEAAETDSIRDHVQSFVHRTGEEITYRRQGPGWIVVSGYHGDQIFYRKAMLACGNQRWHHIAFEYPVEKKRSFDDFVTKASYALKAYGRAGCSSNPPSKIAPSTR
jgi:hypothetical protein